MKTHFFAVSIFLLIRLNSFGQDFSNALAYAEINPAPYTSEGSLSNYEADYSRVINMAPSIFNRVGSYNTPVNMRILQVGSKKNIIIDISDHTSVASKILGLVARNKAKQNTQHRIRPTDLVIADMNENVLFKCNLYWTKTFQIDVTSLRPGYYMVCYHDNSGYVTKGLMIEKD